MLYRMDCLGTGSYRYACKDVSFSGWEQETCPHCGRKISRPVYSEENHILALEGGKKYPDLLQFCGAGSLQTGGRIVVLSEKALAVFQREGILEAEEYRPVALIPSEDCVHPIDDAPNYYAIDIVGTVDLDYAAMSNLRKKHLCPVCNQFEWSRQRLGKMIPDEDTWSGHDICRLVSIPGFVFCSEKVQDAVRKNKLTNFSFI